ncbi:MAG: phosphoribosylpyrophosphate synthetase, partial [Gammaproteobacteria bacterium]|nr:phosphoribosylpyrophosphate synthetase [Gammaproteobacteria bacterium]
RHEGAQQIFGAATHGVLSDPALERLDASPFSKVAVTDTLPPKSNGGGCGLEIVSIAPLLGEAIRRIHEGDSVGELFR